MELNIALEGMFNAENALRSREGVNNPTYLSEHMMRLSQYVGAVEEKLAEYEKDLEVSYAVGLKEYLLVQKMKVTEGQRMVEIDMAELKGQVKYLTRLVSSAWKQVGVAQSRVNHLVRESQMPV